MAGIAREHSGSALPGIVPSNTYRIADDPRYRPNAGRAQHAAAIDARRRDLSGRPTAAQCGTFTNFPAGTPGIHRP